MSETTTHALLWTGIDVRNAAKANSITLTSGLAPSYLQANLIVLPSRYASDFRLLCVRNPVPCPLLAESATMGSYSTLKSYIDGILGEDIAATIDMRQDAPRYMVYENGKLTKSHSTSIEGEWTEDHIAFLIGCSYSFEAALTACGLPPRHTAMALNVPMYRTNVPLCPAGVFSGGTYVVSMRPYKQGDVEKVRKITRPFVSTHGEPMAWGWKAVEALGIKDIRFPEWGDAPLDWYGKPLVHDDAEDVVPVFWGCGVTPQEAVVRANLKGVIMGHAPGHMVVLDVKDGDVFEISRIEGL